ncbi:hypothetical protein IP81_16970 [Novosphingobium sp. AAP83]|uniref:hypothetical protein n=1 Tax=Novosphingobium sp. AAP83 TaxID=1523425 RepID=UPI0006B8E090|nr:hypothetical protein [Novosphingobium sp. AAP83]KPF89345.1 hypothetical protein IP81_16970 [Novosphingobium sp. AAP83]
MTENPYEDHDVDWVKRYRARARKGIDWLVRFTELVVLTAALQFAASKTHNATLGLLTLLLGFAVLFYVCDFVNFLSQPWTRLGKRKWWQWLLTIIATSYFLWVVYRGIENVTSAIEVLAKAQGQ